MTKNIGDLYVLSPIQQGLLYEQTRRPGTGVYVEQLTLTFSGAIDPELFGRAWQAVVDRHPILRTSFHWHEGGTPLQVVHRRAELAVDVWDWRDRPAGDQEDELRRWLTRERLAGFPLDQAPLMRATLIRRDDRRWTFAWRFSHLLMDGWSFGLGIHDFFAHYRAYHQGKEPDVLPAVPYREYVGWWRRQRPGHAESFWRDALGGFVPGEPLMWAPEPVGVDMGVHDFVHVTLGDLAGDLQALARAHQLTLPTVTQAAWVLLLSRHLGVDDLVTGVTIAHRPPDLAGAEGILGPMIVTLPVRTRIDRDERLSTWLRSFQTQQATLREHSTLPLVDIQRLAELPTSVPLLETTVSYENVPLPDLRLGEVGLSLDEAVYDGRTHYPITMVIMPGDDMPLRVMFDLRRFGRDAGRAIADQLGAMLEQFARRPDARLAELDPRTAGERAAFAAQIETPLATTGTGTLHERFAARAAEAPDTVALISGDITLSYAELDRAAANTAASLAAAGVGRGTLVGICAERSAELVVAILAVLKAGGGYVPLDPAYPEQRLRHLLSDSKADVVLATADTADRASGARIVPLEIDVAEPAPSPAVAVTGDDLAYVLYTSGSTGQPKGVRITHANVLGLIGAAREAFGFDTTDVWTMCHSYAFDYTVWEMWGALLHGGQLVIVPTWASRTPNALYDLVASHGVTVFSQTPAAFEQFVAEEVSRPMPADLRLRYVFLGADRLDPRTLRPWAERHDPERIRLVNIYGITETSVVSTYHPITADEIAHGTPNVIGRPLTNQRLYLLDELGAPVASGIPGEIHISGPAVGAGYHGRADLTRERFVPDPFVPGARMYRTGDLARTRPDGALEYLGRADGQVKVRGYRIELGDIEAALRGHAAVRTALAVVRLGAAGDPMIVGYAVPREHRVSEAELLVHLRDRLPAHMVPAAVAWVDAIPTTPNGKIDHAALPPPEAGGTSGLPRIAPRDDAERAIAEAVCELLALDEVGVLDDLAVLGLHSVLVMRLAAAIRLRLGVEVSLDELMNGATVERLAKAVALAGER